MSGSQVRPTRYYSYFKSIEREYDVPNLGRMKSTPELKWYGILSSKVLVLKHQLTPLTPLAGETKRILHEWVVVTDEEANLPIRFESIGGFDEYGRPYPSYGIFVRQQTQYPNNTIERDYLPREQMYNVVDLVTKPGDFGIVQLFANGVREVVTHLDNLTWNGPGSAIVYDRESSFGWLTRSGADDFVPEQHGPWTPGRASVYERFLFGTGTMDGWCVYALQNVLVFEMWQTGTLVASRVLDCLPLNQMEEDPDNTYVLGFGYDFERGVISMGVTGVGPGGSGIVHKEWQVPELKHLNYPLREIYIGGTPFNYTDGSEAHRTAWGFIKPIQGDFTSDDFLTKGKLTELTRFALDTGG